MCLILPSVKLFSYFSPHVTRDVLVVEGGEEIYYTEKLNSIRTFSIDETAFKPSVIFFSLADSFCKTHVNAALLPSRV